MNYFSIRLDNYAAQNTETALNILQSDQTKYAFGDQTEELHPSQPRNQPVIHGDNPYNLPTLPSNSTDPLEHNNASPYSIDKFSHMGFTHNQTWPPMAMGQVYGLGGLDGKANGGMLGNLAETQQELQANGILPYGVTGNTQAMDHPWLGAESYDIRPTNQNATMGTQMICYNEGTNVRGRGRPRVNPKDETTAERRRTQIRLAQRAYRQRQDTAISSLEKKAQGLIDVKEEMANIMVDLYSNAACIGLLQREPEFSELLQSSAERFSTLAKGSVNDSPEDDPETNGAESG